MRGVVWGKTFKDAVIKLESIENDYKRLGIQTMNKKKTQYDYSIQFSNGDYWRAVPAHESLRACRSNVCYIDINIDLEFINVVIRPTITLPPYSAIHYYRSLDKD